jgi:hypothetical protein
VVKYRVSSVSLIGNETGICCRLKYSAPYLPIARFVVRSSSRIFSAAKIYALRIDLTSPEMVLISPRLLLPDRAAVFAVALSSRIAFERSTAVGLLPMR